MLRSEDVQLLQARKAAEVFFEQDVAEKEEHWENDEYEWMKEEEWEQWEEWAKEEMEGAKEEVEEIEAVKQRARSALSSAAANGALEDALNKLRYEKKDRTEFQKTSCCKLIYGNVYDIGVFYFLDTTI